MNPEDNLRIPDICPEHSQLSQDIALIRQEMQQNNEMTAKILLAVEGNGQVGLKTQAQLNKAATKRAWIWIASMSGAIIVMAGFDIKGMLSK